MAIPTSPFFGEPREGRFVQVEGEYFMVTEIPKNTKPKMEIATKESLNPIAQDTKLLGLD